MCKRGLEALLLNCKAFFSEHLVQVTDLCSDQWAAEVNDRRWSWSGLLPYFKRTETFYPTSDQERMDVAATHGFDGPIKVGHAFLFRV